MMAAENQTKRNRNALTILLVGIALLLLAWGILMHASRPQATTGPVEMPGRPAPPGLTQNNAPVPSETERHVLVLAGAVLITCFLLALVFLVGSYVLVRGGRSYRDHLLRKPQPATHDEDVWSMHKLPDASDEGDDEETRVQD